MVKCHTLLRGLLGGCRTLDRPAPRVDTTTVVLDLFPWKKSERVICTSKEEEKND